MTSDVGLIGLAVMGQNLALNMESRGNTVSVFNRTTSKTMDFVERHPGNNLKACRTLEEFVDSIKSPRRIMLMVQAGRAVDAVVGQLVPLLDEGDTIMDGGNTYYEDTEKRAASLVDSGIHYMGVGVSGGELGARFGPSLMPGGPPAAWAMVKDLLESIAAKAPDGEPCVALLGPGGAGNAVKTVHNGCEYGVMQLIAETYHSIRRILGISTNEIGHIFESWQNTELSSYLVEITAIVLGHSDEDGEPLVERILDQAGAKGTGKWTVEMALSIGAPVPTIGAAVDARNISSTKEERVAASTVLDAGLLPSTADEESYVTTMQEALYCAILITYAQALSLLDKLSAERNYNLDLAAVASLWRAGCIIRAGFLDDISKALQEQPDKSNLLLCEPFRTEVANRLPSLRKVVIAATQHGIPVPAFTSALQYYDAYRTATLPANIIQGLRDCFGAHTYKRTDRPGSFHTEWITE
ncbi:6-phosphogluconate dehydrogenase, decarboxylating [Kipferlia bialata]|uniref:6-phosphogluconate dehydrogenase, decarboxylating n=1 Tax=Kipferlia bialata TaxID=797122 RepID=A0A9K3CRJ1_9EUKA|nr:6-phosphogluconate dehydrogenase, decarboxylating [Kipferlia bialata]|eukprot:g2051.t1